MLESILSISASVILGILLFVLRSIHQRLGSVEDATKRFMPKHEVRELIEDKIGGIREDITEIKDKINRLFEIYIDDHARKKSS